MYTDREYKKRIKQLEPLAVELITEKMPEDARETASKMTPDDAFILGTLIGGILQARHNSHVIIQEVESFDTMNNRKKKEEDIEDKDESVDYN